MVFSTSSNHQLLILSVSFLAILNDLCALHHLRLQCFATFSGTTIISSNVSEQGQSAANKAEKLTTGSRAMGGEMRLGVGIYAPAPEQSEGIPPPQACRVAVLQRLGRGGRRNGNCHLQGMGHMSPVKRMIILVIEELYVALKKQAALAQMTLSDFQTRASAVLLLQRYKPLAIRLTYRPTVGNVSSG
jgi:hypothetical protein